MYFFEKHFLPDMKVRKFHNFFWNLTKYLLILFFLGYLKYHHFDKGLEVNKGKLAAKFYWHYFYTHMLLNIILLIKIVGT